MIKKKFKKFKEICEKIDHKLCVEPTCGPLEIPGVENAFKNMNTNAISGKAIGIFVLVAFILGQILIISTR